MLAVLVAVLPLASAGHKPELAGSSGLVPTHIIHCHGAGRGGAVRAGGHRWRAELPSPGMSPPVMDQEAAGGWGWTLRMWQLGHNSVWSLVHVSVLVHKCGSNATPVDNASHLK